MSSALHAGSVPEALLPALFFASFFGPLALEHWMHRRRADRLARFAF